MSSSPQPTDDPPLDDLKAGLLGRYVIMDRLGAGGMAVVYRARDLRHERVVALKVLRPELTLALGVERFQREIRLTAGLQHPHLVSVLDSGETAGHLWYTMPYIDGESLRERLTRERQLPVAEAVRIALEAARGIAAAHQRGIVHRDVKPENLLLARDGHTMVADFGVARSQDAAGVTRTGLSVGTPLYMAPEQAGGSASPDPRSDIYALGCILYEMLAGEPPFTASSQQGVLAKHMNAPIPDVGVLRSTVSEGLRQVVRTALAKAPADRFPTATAFAEALERSVSAPATSGPGRRRRMAAGGLLLLVTVVVLLARPYWRSERSAEAAVPAYGPDRIAVLYLGTRIPDVATRGIADGLTEGLIRELSRIGAFQVVSRNGVMPFRGRSVPFDSMVSAVGATLVVDGTVERTGDGIVVRVDLIDARSDSYLESLSITRPFTDAPSLEGELVRQVASALRRQLGRKARLREVVAGTTNEAARVFMLKAERARQDASTMARQSHPEDVRSALAASTRADSLLGLAQAEDPAWLRPLIERSRVALDHAALLSGSDRAARLEYGLRFAEEAVRRAPEAAEALELRGTLRWRLVTEFEGAVPDSSRLQAAEADLQAALDRDSTLASAWATLAFLLSGNGKFAEASIAARRALEEDAYLEDAPQIYLELFYGGLMRAEYEEAGRWCLRGRTEFPGDWRFVECELTLLRGNATAPPDPDSAWALVSELERLDPAEKAKAAGRVYHTIYRPLVAATLSARAGNATLARAELARARKATADSAPLRLDLAYDEAYLLLVLGERKEAESVLRYLIEARPVLGPLLARDPLFRGATIPLRSE